MAFVAGAKQTRLQRETARLHKELPRPPILSLEELSQERCYRAEILGPEDSAFSGARFGLLLAASDEYPFKPPSIRFASPRRVFHPNVCPTSGGICLDILNDVNLWSPAMGLEKLLLSVVSLLSEPRTEHGLNKKALDLLRTDPAAFAARAAEVCGVAASTATPAAPSSSSSPEGTREEEGGGDDIATPATVEAKPPKDEVAEPEASAPVAAPEAETAEPQSANQEPGTGTIVAAAAAAAAAATTATTPRPAYNRGVVEGATVDYSTAFWVTAIALFVGIIVAQQVTGGGG